MAKAILKPWYARSVLEEKTRLCDVFSQLATRAFDGGTGIGDEFQTTKVLSNTLDLDLAFSALSSSKSPLIESVHPRLRVKSMVGGEWHLRIHGID